jgi:hypothetical protein
MQETLNMIYLFKENLRTNNLNNMYFEHLFELYQKNMRHLSFYG